MERHTEDVNVSLDDAVNILTATSKICLKIKPKSLANVSRQKWFDRECRLKRYELRRVSNQKHRDPFNQLWVTGEISQDLDWLQKKESISDWKISETRRTRIKSQQRIVLELFKVNERYYRRECPAPISEETWLNHFQSLYSNDPITSTQRQEI